MQVMDVAFATGAVSRPFNFMAARGSDNADEGLNAPTPSAETKSDPLTNRFPMIAFSYDVDASRLVMLYRDPANGKTVSQIPTEAALKQYKEAQLQEKQADRTASLRMTIGDAGAANEASLSGSAGNNVAAGANALSAGTASVAHFTPSTTHAAAVAVAGVGSGASTATSRVNVVI